MYEARQALTQGAEAAPDAQLLAVGPKTEDTYGSPAANAYARLAEAGAGSGTDRSTRWNAASPLPSASRIQNKRNHSPRSCSRGNSQARALLGAEQRSDNGALIPAA